MSSTSSAGPELPSLDLVRQLTDRHVIGQLIAEPTLTRAELATRTTISKPTVSESVRRLEAAGLVTESGRQSGKRGPSGLFYRLRDDVGFGLVVSLGPDGVIVETVDLRGTTHARAEASVPGPATAADLEPVLGRLVDEAVGPLPGRPLAATVNVAGPVDQVAQRLVRLPNSPYFADAFDPAGTFRTRVGGPVRIDNDVNWAAVAERSDGAARGHDDLLYAYLGPGIGSAIYAGGALVRGHRGLAGELANVATTGPGGRSRRLADCFADWGLRRPGTEAIDLDALAAVLTGRGRAERQRSEQIARAVADALGSLAAALDPELILLAGPWARVGGLDRRVTALIEADPATRVLVRAAELGRDAAHRGARTGAVAGAREELLRQVADRGADRVADGPWP